MNTNTVTFVASHLACGEARRGSMSLCGPVTEEQRSHRPNGAQPGGRQVFLAQAALLAPHRPVEGMLVGRALPAPKIPCRERHPIYVHDHLESPDSRNELWRFYAPFPQSWQGDFPQFSFWISERSCGRFARGVATSDLTAENAKSAERSCSAPWGVIESVGHGPREFCPGGTFGISPAFQRRGGQKRDPRPEGTIEDTRRPQSSLRDGTFFRVADPALKRRAYSQKPLRGKEALWSGRPF